MDFDNQLNNVFDRLILIAHFSDHNSIKVLVRSYSELFLRFHSLIFESCEGCNKIDSFHDCYDLELIKSSLEQTLETAFENGDISYTIYRNICSKFRLDVSY